MAQMRAIRRNDNEADAEIYELLTRKHHDEHPQSRDKYAERPEMIPYLREAMCFAATLGFQVGNRIPLSGKTAEIRSGTFESEEHAITLIWALAVAETQGTEILRPEHQAEMVKIFEEYANGGLSEIRRWLKETPDDPYGDEAIREGLRNAGFFAPGAKKIDLAKLNPGF